MEIKSTLGKFLGVLRYGIPREEPLYFHWRKSRLRFVYNPTSSPLIVEYYIGEELQRRETLGAWTLCGEVVRCDKIVEYSPGLARSLGKLGDYE